MTATSHTSTNTTVSSIRRYVFLSFITFMLYVADCKVLRQIHSRNTCKLRTWDSVVTLTVEFSVYHCCYSLMTLRKCIPLPAWFHGDRKLGIQTCTLLIRNGKLLDVHLAQSRHSLGRSHTLKALLLVCKQIFPRLFCDIQLQRL
jgi:hypothetical protein